MSFWNHVVYSPGLNGSSIAQTVLTQMVITLQYTRTYNIPFRAIATLVATQSALMLYPSFTTMFIAVTRTVCGCTDDELYEWMRQKINAAQDLKWANEARAKQAENLSALEQDITRLEKAAALSIARMITYQR